MLEAINSTAQEKANHLGEILNGEMKNIGIENNPFTSQEIILISILNVDVPGKVVNEKHQLEITFSNINKFVFIKHSNPFGNAISGLARFKKEIRPHSNSVNF